MITLSATPFITEHLKAINENLVERGEGPPSKRQQWFLAFCLLGLLVTQSLCWGRFSRAGLGEGKPGALSEMFIHSKISWKHLLAASLRRLFKEYGIKGGTLVVDDTDRGRSKNTSRIFGVHKGKDKGTAGYHCTQIIVLLLLVTNPKEKIELLKSNISQSLNFRDSSKHMSVTHFTRSRASPAPLPAITPADPSTR